MNRNNVEEIKSRIPIEELIGSYVKLEKAGKSFKARCPFHNEKTASFFISPDRGGYYCFGCGAKGDIFSFVEQFEGLDFKGALKVLAEKAGVKLVFEHGSDNERDKLFEIIEESTHFFEDKLSSSNEALMYVRSRGISDDTRKLFRIGYAPDGWKHLLTYLKSKGWAELVIEKAGLAKKGDKGDFYDRFRGRIMFPITDSSGRVVGFTGRIHVDDGKSAKYLNSPDTPLFNKSQILFGLDKAKIEIRRLNYSILVEGQMDLVLSHQVGVKNVVAASGTALTDQALGENGIVSNLGMVRRLSPNMIIALDSDKAGRTAAMKAVAATALSMGMSVKIADLTLNVESAKDPADIILSNPEKWKIVLKNAKHVIEFELGNIMKEISDPHKFSKSIKDRVFPFLSKIDSEMDKAFYIKMIAEKMGLSEQAVWEDLRKFGREKIAEKEQKKTSDTKKYSEAHVNSALHHSDLIQRRLFGLLALMESAKFPAAKDYREQLESISAGSFKVVEENLKSGMTSLMFEAETLFGDKQENWDIHMKEMILNYEEDIINDELVRTMFELKKAEIDGNMPLVHELAKKYQLLSIRKVEISKKRK